MQRALRMQQYFEPDVINIEQNFYDASYYVLDLTVFPDEERISGNVTIKVISLVARLNSVTLDFKENMNVTSVSQNELSLPYNHLGDELIVSLDRDYSFGEEISFTVSYEGTPVKEGSFASFDFSTHNGNPVISTLSEPFGARTWWPCKDDPADKADSVDIIVTVPNNLIVASNGLMKDIRENNDNTRTFIWEERYPIATYLVSLAISNYDVFSDYYRYSETDSMEVVYYVYPEDLEDAKVDFEPTVDMIEFFSSVFGQYPFIEEKYGIAEFPWSGAMEHQTCTSYGSNLIRGDNRYDYINAHELAHQWFGDLVTMKNWSDIWLNEGFATYSEALWYEHVNGRHGLFEYMRFLDIGFFPTTVFVSDSTNVSALFSRTVYNKGGWALHMLRYILGDEKFFIALQNYADAYKYGNVTTERFKTVCEQVYGKDLDWFFEQWVYGLYRPYYQFEWSDEFIGGEYVVNMNIEQIQSSATTFKMPLDILVKTSAGDTTIVVWDSLAVQSFQFKLNSEPYNISIDPDGWVLKSARLREVLQPLVLYENYPNPFVKTTIIEYEIPYTGTVKLDIYNTLGQHIVTLVDEKQFSQQRNFAIWNGKNATNFSVSNGVYYYRLRFDYKYTKVGKLVKLH